MSAANANNFMAQWLSKVSEHVIIFLLIQKGFLLYLSRTTVYIGKLFCFQTFFFCQAIIISPVSSFITINNIADIFPI